MPRGRGLKLDKRRLKEVIEAGILYNSAARSHLCLQQQKRVLQHRTVYINIVIKIKNF